MGEQARTPRPRLGTGARAAGRDRPVVRRSTRGRRRAGALSTKREPFIRMSLPERRGPDHVQQPVGDRGELPEHAVATEIVDRRPAGADLDQLLHAVLDHRSSAQAPPARGRADALDVGVDGMPKGSRYMLLKRVDAARVSCERHAARRLSHDERCGRRSPASHARQPALLSPRTVITPVVLAGGQHHVHSRSACPVRPRVHRPSNRANRVRSAGAAAGSSQMYASPAYGLSRAARPKVARQSRTGSVSSPSM